VLRSGNLAQGPVVAQLESAFAELCGVPHAVAVSNGTVALVAALKALRIGPGDEVITTPFSFAATLNAILESGATVGSPTSATTTRSTRTRWPRS
jgi:dTDP-4-amino-4,6-dideoxygalactose transaminase